MIIMVQVYETVMYTLDEILMTFNASNSESASIVRCCYVLSVKKEKNKWFS